LLAMFSFSFFSLLISLSIFFLSSFSVNFFYLSSLSFFSPLAPSSTLEKFSSFVPPRQVSLLLFLFFCHCLVKMLFLIPSDKSFCWLHILNQFLIQLWLWKPKLITARIVIFCKQFIWSWLFSSKEKLQIVI
jgi:hypothetical protein